MNEAADAVHVLLPHKSCMYVLSGYTSMAEQVQMSQLALLFRNANAIAKARRPFTDMEWMCDLDEEKGLDVGMSYRTDKKCCSGVSSDSKAKAKGFLKKLSSRKTILLGSFATDVIDILHTTSLAIQSPCYSPGHIIETLKLAVIKLEALTERAFATEAVALLFRNFASILEKWCEHQYCTESEWSLLKDIVLPNEPGWTDVFKNAQNSCPNVLQLVDLLLSLPDSSADCERGFSLSKAVCGSAGEQSEAFVMTRVRARRQAEEKVSNVRKLGLSRVQQNPVMLRQMPAIWKLRTDLADEIFQGFSPFEVQYHWDVRGPLDILREATEKSSKSVVAQMISIRDKMETMTALWQGPDKVVKQIDVRAFLGLTGYYCYFIPNFTSLAAPLTDLTKTAPMRVTWTEQCDQAFKDLKGSLTSSPVLQNLDFEKSCILQTDASDRGIDNKFPSFYNLLT
eukprot:Em0012g540a